MSIHISEARVAQVKEVINNWCYDFSKPLSEADALESIQRDFDPNVEWYDHGFQICRVGHQAVLGLRKGFRHCNDPFRAEIKVRRRAGKQRFLRMKLTFPSEPLTHR